MASMMNSKFNTVVVRRKRMQNSGNGTVEFNVDSIELNGQKLPYVTKAAVNLEARQLRTLTVTFVVDDVTFVDEE